MPAKDTGGQKRTSKTSEETEEVEAQASSDVAERKGKLDDDISIAVRWPTRAPRQRRCSPKSDMTFVPSSVSAGT